MTPHASPVRPAPDGALVAVKVVPGASRDEAAGLLGDRVKLRVSAPPEGGKANDAAAALLADLAGVAARDVVLQSGASSPTKTFLVRGCAAEDLRSRLGG